MFLSKSLPAAAIFILSMVLLFSGQAFAHEGSGVLCVAHRGGAALAPENTLAAFENAIKTGADYFELDVHLSKDGHVMVFHDDLLDRTTDGKGMIKDKTMAELKKLDAGSWFSEKFRGEKIPTLDEALKMAKGRIGVVIEIKNGPTFYDGISEKVVKIIEANQMENNVIVISFDHQCLKDVKKLNPAIKTGILYYANILGAYRLAGEAGADYIGPGYEMVTPLMIEECHKNNIKLNPWTVNSEHDMKRLINLGIDAITTDRPDILKKILDGRN